MVQIEEITIIDAPIERCFDLARSVEVHLAVTWRARHFGVWQNLTSEITAMESPAYFRDDHYFRALLHERNSVLKQIAESGQ